MNFKQIAGTSVLKVKKYSPELLVVTGIVGLVTGTVMVVKANTKAAKVLEESKKQLENIDYCAANETEEVYSSKDRKKDLAIVYSQTGFELVKTYGPGVTLVLGSVACILGAHNIMRKRNIALIAAYKAVEQGFSEYRSRVVSELGVDKDRQFKYGFREETVAEKITDEETGKTKTVKSKVSVTDPNNISQYAKFFDESCPQWSKTPEYNLLFLKSQQNYANNLLHARGHVFLNEVYESLGLPHTQAGSIVGWVINKEGDNYIDFGIFDVNIPKNRDFVNGYERSILLDFNVDGVIYDKI